MKTRYTLLCLMMSVGLLAQTSPEEYISKFFEDYETVGAEQALTALYSTNEWVMRNQDAVENVKRQLSDINRIVGQYRGHELIVQRTAGSSFTLHAYLVKYDRQPVRFTFEFYRPQDEWIIFSFAFDEELDDELEESAKLYIVGTRNE